MSSGSGQGQALGGTSRVPRSQQKKVAPSTTTAPSCPMAPPGFELLFQNECSKLTSPFQAFILPLHWSIVRGGLRLRLTQSPVGSGLIPLNELTEILPENWTSEITVKPEEGTERPMNNLILRYWLQSNPKIHFELKVMEIVKNEAVVALLFRAVNGYGIDGNVEPVNKINMDSSSATRNSAGSNFMIQDYLKPGVSFQTSKWFEVYKNLQNLENIVWEHLMDQVGLSVSGKQKPTGPYESKSSVTQEQAPSQSPPPYTYPQEPMPLQPIGGIGGPLHTPPVPVGPGSLGRSDLDPVGGFGGGMVADPRGFRQPIMPLGGTGPGGLLPPGARFDPFGPPNPGSVGGPQPPPPRSNWGVPDPDAEPSPPGFEDMFM